MARPLRLSSDQILSAAERVFARRGYGETSLRQLMAAARVSTTAFYARFASKEAVLVALVDRLLAELRDSVEEAVGRAGSREEVVERGVDVVVATLARHEKLVALMLGEGLSSPGVRRGLGRAYAALVEFVTAQQSSGPRADAIAAAGSPAGGAIAAAGSRTDGAIAAGGSRADGAIAAVDPAAVAWAFVGAVQIHVARWAVFEEIDRDRLSTALRQAAHTLLPTSGRRGAG